MNDDLLFDKKMKEKFKKELHQVPRAIDEELKNTLVLIKNQGDETMRKSFSFKKSGIIAASIVCALFITMQTTFAQDLVNKIIESLSLKNVTIFENEKMEWKDRIVPEPAQGKVFDQKGNIVKVITSDNQDQLYTEKGEKVFGVEDDGTLLTEEVLKQREGEPPLIVEDISKLNDYACFEVKLPTYLPKGYVFEKAEFFKDDNGKIIDDDCSLGFINRQNGEHIYISQRVISETSSFETSFENIKKVKVNGLDAILGDEGITWEANGINYFMYTYDLGRAESIKIAESVK